MSGRKKGIGNSAKRYHCEECRKSFEDWYDFVEHKCESEL